MNIVSAQYIADLKTNENTAIWVSDGIKFYSVPLAEANSDYAEIMRQVEAGELTIQDADPV
jgi:hypothetical protein